MACQALAEKPVVGIEREGAKAEPFGFRVVACRLLQRGQAGQCADRTGIDVSGLSENAVGLVDQPSLQTLLGVGNEVDFQLVACQVV